MSDMMSDVIKRGTATRALVLNRNDISGKTGTTNDKRDTWFCGFNADIVATAWIGFDQERSLGNHEEGGRTALPMWVYFMQEALKGLPEHRQPAPPGLVTMKISPRTGRPVSAGDPDAVFETFIAGHVPEPDAAGSESNPSSDEADHNDKKDESLF
jgi:penicillin-binding protein 1A